MSSVQKILSIAYAIVISLSFAKGAIAGPIHDAIREENLEQVFEILNRDIYALLEVDHLGKDGLTHLIRASLEFKKRYNLEWIKLVRSKKASKTRPAGQEAIALVVGINKEIPTVVSGGRYFCDTLTTDWNSTFCGDIFSFSLEDARRPGIPYEQVFLSGVCPVTDLCGGEPCGGEKCGYPSDTIHRLARNLKQLMTRPGYLSIRGCWKGGPLGCYNGAQLDYFIDEMEAEGFRLRSTYEAPEQFIYPESAFSLKYLREDEVVPNEAQKKALQKGKMLEFVLD